MDHAMVQQVVEYPEEHEAGGDMKVEVAYDGVLHHNVFWYKHKKRSKVWEEYKPIFLNGKVQFVECLYCHSSAARTPTRPATSGGTRRSARASRSRWQKDSYFPYVSLNEHSPVSPIDPVNVIISETLDDIGSVIPSRFKSKVWKEFTPVYVEGKLQAADCIHCQKRLSGNKFGGRTHLSRHFLTCPGRCGIIHDQQKIAAPFFLQ